MWHPVRNDLKIIIDPFIFAGLKNLSERVLLVNTFKHYFNLLDPSLCKVTFIFPKYLEERLGFRRTFMPGDDVTLIIDPPKEIIDFLDYLPKEVKTETFSDLISATNETFSLAIEHKCAFVLTEMKLTQEKMIDFKRDYNIELNNIPELFKNIEIFTQGFFNYFKFSNSVYGIGAPDIAHAMSDRFHNTILIQWESIINKNNSSQDTRERIRSFVHNRYIDILISTDQINFYKLQQRLDDLEHGTVDNKRPILHGYIRYYINYYLFLLWGSLDHLAWITNDIFAFGYNIEDINDSRAVGFKNTKTKKEYFEKIKSISEELHAFLVSKDFQEWFYFFSQLRNKSAHREMFSASPLLLTTPESQVSDEEIDAILYKDEQPFDEETANSIKKVMGEEVFKQMEENQKINDRANYRISKTKKGMDHFAMIEKDGQNFMFNPVARLDIDMTNLKKLITLIFEAYKKHVTAQ